MQRQLLVHSLTPNSSHPVAIQNLVSQPLFALTKTQEQSGNLRWISTSLKQHLSGIPMLVRKGYEVLKLSGFQDRQLCARFLASIYESHDALRKHY